MFENFESTVPTGRSTLTPIASLPEVHVSHDGIEKSWWRGKQWAVTADGMDCLEFHYSIDAVDLARRSHGSDKLFWLQFMGEKIWVDIDEFATAWMVALLLHGKSDAIDPAQIRKVITELHALRQLAR